MSEILDNIYILVLLVNSEIVLRLAFVKYTLQLLYLKLYFLYFFEAKNFCFGTKYCSKSSYICVYICPKNSTINSRKRFITQRWLVVESCTTARWIAFWMLYRLVHNIISHFNELILACSVWQNSCSGVCPKCAWPITLQDFWSVISVKKNWGIKLIFCLQVNVKGSYKLVLLFCRCGQVFPKFPKQQV